MVMERPMRHLNMPPPRYQGEGLEVADVAGEGEGVEVGEEAAEGDGAEGERDELIDSDFDTNGEDNNEQREIEYHRLEDQVVRDSSESGESTEDEEEDVVDNDGDLNEHGDSDDGEGGGQSYHVFNLEEIYDPTFELGMQFSNKLEFKNGAADCEWKMYAIKIKGEETFQINLIKAHHSCPQIFEVKNVKTNWIKDKYLQKFKSDPKRCVKGFRVDIINELRVNVSKQQAYRAKKAALKEIEGSPDWQYSRLWDYAEEIRRTNPNSTVIVGTEKQDGEERFSRFYVCFVALKVGFSAGCRPIMGVDGCHLKGPHGGILLTAHDLNIVRQHEYTFISDKQKGLMQAFDEVFPGSDHRFCVKHLHNNFKQADFRGLTFKNALWNAAKACTVDCYTVETYRRVYAPAIRPMSHEGIWSESCIIPPLPPNFGRGAGRPAKARRRESDEPTLKNKKKSKRKQVTGKRKRKTPEPAVQPQGGDTK
ncbi:UNVERIFIED_CONTAM: hypothetical protein Slati_2532800 [Sesamum latifolium]|uniref:MULE transposase domain-containing protein n=1 Tax=Sesamum latifolium TaxID=2727402 RepID=A0AAW2WG81_9LAMI